MSLERDDCGFFASILQNENSVGVYFNALEKRIEFDFIVNGKSLHDDFTLIQLYHILKKANG